MTRLAIQCRLKHVLDRALIHGGGTKCRNWLWVVRAVPASPCRTQSLPAELHLVLLERLRFAFDAVISFLNGTLWHFPLHILP